MTERNSTALAMIRDVQNALLPCLPSLRTFAAELWAMLKAEVVQ